MKNGKSIAGLVLAILSVVVTIINCLTAGLLWFLGLLALAFGIVGIILAAKGMKEAKANGTSSGLAVAALVIAIVGTSFSGIMCITCNLCTCLCEGAAGAAATAGAATSLY